MTYHFITSSAKIINPANEMLVKLEQEDFLSTAVQSMTSYTNFIKDKEILTPSNFISRHISQRNSYTLTQRKTKIFTITLFQIFKYF